MSVLTVLGVSVSVGVLCLPGSTGGEDAALLAVLFVAVVGHESAPGRASLRGVGALPGSSATRWQKAYIKSFRLEYMAIKFDEVFITFRGDEEQTHEPFINAVLMDNGWLKVDVPLDDGTTIQEFYSPHEIKSFYEP